MYIYADNAATTRMSDAAVAAMGPYFQEIYGNPSSLHSIGQRAAEALDDARGRIAACLGAQKQEIYFTSGGSEADNQALLSAAAIGARRGKRHIISSAFEHHAVLHTLDKLRRDGFEIELLPIGAVCREKGVLFHTDAVQAAGHLPIDVAAQQIDMLSLSAHKFHGPRGVGVLYCKKGVLLTSLINGGAQERGKRAGTENLAGIAGMAAALEDACAHMDENAAKVAAMRDRLIAGLLKIPHSVLNGDPVHRLPGNVHFCFEGIEGESLLLLLDEKGICASSGSACTSGSLDPSHVLLALGHTHEIAHGSLRLTLCADNTMEQMDTIVAAVTDVVDYLRNMSPLWRDKCCGKREFLLK